MKKINLILSMLMILVLTLLFFSCGSCEHEYDEGRITKEPSCTLEGIITYTCQKCGDTERQVVDPKPHDNTVISSVDATCATEGSRKVKCEVCQTVTDEVIPKSDHNFSLMVSSTAASCAIGGTKTYKCTSCSATNTITTEPTGNHVFHTAAEYMMIKTVPTETTTGTKVTFCKTCTLEKTTPYYYTDYQKDIFDAQLKLDNVDITSFTDKKISTMDTSAYADPLAYPTSGEHPRLIINTTTLAQIKEALKKPEYAEFFNEVIRVANGYDSGLLGEAKEVPVASGKGPKGFHNLDEELYDCLMAKAFLYLITGVEIYAIDAVRMTKEFIATIDIKSTAYDPERNWGYAMYAAAIVYDWCYDVMDAQDKEDLVRGIEWRLCKTVKGNSSVQNMEISFPPSKQGAVCGHGSERQLLRDYLSVALAIYDEYPTWYDYIGGRFYQDYVPVRNEFYKAGMYPQGISTYVQIRFTSDVWSALLMKSAIGEIPYEGDMAEILHSLYNRVVDGKYTIFEEGDDELRGGKNILQCVAFAGTALGYLYNDSTCMAWADYMDYSGTSWLYQLIFKSTGVKPTENRYDELDLICYNGGYMNEIIAHSDFTSTATSVLMKIGGRTTANHDHGDAGSFQIYYKKILAGDTGYYDSYGTDHFKYYHQATIAHNSIVIYRNTKTIGQKNGSSYPEPKTYDEWMTDQYRTANLSGVSYEYMDETKKQVKYAYIAGDIAPAYQGVLTKGDRRMLAVFDTQNPDVPMYFFVYDNFTGTSNSDAMIFLLHTTSKPTIEGNTVSALSGSGKLVLQNIKGGDSIEAIGGIRNNFVVNGTHVETDDYTTTDYWGRVEIKTENSSKNDVQLNVMYVTDASNKTSYEATELVGNTVSGAIIGNTAAVFVEESANSDKAISFSTVGATDNINYYVSGVKAGNWTVTVGNVILTVSATEEAGLLTFTAPAGVVTISPN